MYDDAGIQRYLPVKPVVFHLLIALAEESDAYGYGLIQSVRRRSGGRIQLQTGAFYRHLRKLLDDGLVEEAAAAPSADDPRRGAYYRLTPLGSAVMRAEWRRLAELVAATGELGIMGGEESA